MLLETRIFCGFKMFSVSIWWTTLFYCVFNLCFGFHSDLSMNNITELPAYVFKNFPYLEELWVHAHRFFLLMMYLLCTRAFWISTITFELVVQYQCTACPPFQLQKCGITWGWESLIAQELDKGRYKQCSKAQLNRWGETTCIEAAVTWHPVWIFAFKGLSWW